jgi:hypothetical protein
MDLSPVVCVMGGIDIVVAFSSTSFVFLVCD